MLSAALLLAALAALTAGILGGFTGFGLSAIVVPLLLLVYEPATVVVLNGALSASVAAAVVRDSWREADRRVVFVLAVAALPSLAVGAEALRTLDPAYLKLTVGVMVVVSAILLLRDIRLPGANTRLGAVITGSLSGALASSTGLSGSPAVLLLASHGLPKEVFRATIALFFLALDIALLAVLALWGILEPGTHALLALVLVPAALLGKVLGTALFKKVSQKTFRAASLSIVALIAALGIATAFRALLS